MNVEEVTAVWGSLHPALEDTPPGLKCLGMANFFWKSKQIVLQPLKCWASN